jgi:predicted nucleic acid-binding protein
MPKTIISDTSCFIILSNIGALDILQKVYRQIISRPLKTSKSKFVKNSDLNESIKNYQLISQKINYFAIRIAF